VAEVVAVSTNPAIDRVALATDVRRGGIRRADAFLETPGGKAAHVVMVAQALGADARLVAPAGGRRGELLAALLEEEGVSATLVATAGETRGTYTVVDAAEADIVEVHEPAEAMSEAEAERLVAAATTAAADAKVVITAGSLPPGAPADLPALIVRAARAAGAFTVVDTSSGEALLTALAETPDLVTPNLQEAAALGEDEVGADAPLEELAALARRLQGRGAQAVWLSVGPRGSLLAVAEAVWHLTPPPPRAVVNAVGCGDALVGGLAAGIVRGLELRDAARLGVAAATDKLASLHPGRVDREAVEALRDRVAVRQVE